MPIDVAGLRKNYAEVLAQQQKQALQGAQNIYAGRGTTGSGEEAQAFAETGRQYGLGAASQEQALQGMLNQQEQFNQGQQNWQQQFNQQESQFGKQLGEQGRQFDVGQGNWQQQFGFNKGIQEAGLTGLYNNKQILPVQQQLAQMYSEGQLTSNPFKNNPGIFGNLADPNAMAKENQFSSSQDMAMFMANPGMYNALRKRRGLPAIDISGVNPGGTGVTVY